MLNTKKIPNPQEVSKKIDENFNLIRLKNEKYHLEERKEFTNYLISHKEKFDVLPFFIIDCLKNATNLPLTLNCSIIMKEVNKFVVEHYLVLFLRTYLKQFEEVGWKILIISESEINKNNKSIKINISETSKTIPWYTFKKITNSIFNYTLIFNTIDMSSDHVWCLYHTPTVNSKHKSNKYRKVR